MKQIISGVLILILLIGGLAYQAPVKIYAENILYKSQCDTPQTYRIGKIDPKYNMTREDFINRIDEGANIWGNSIGKKLFTYSPDGEIEVNLVYDERQFLSSRIDELDSKVKDQQRALDPEIVNYKSRAASFRARAAQLNNDIEGWNSRGGAPEGEFEKLKSRQANLQNEAIALQNEAERLNQSTEQFNTQVGELRQTVNNFNQQLSFKPEEGEYIVNRGTRTINIYFDNSQPELVHTLAHELGHALEISHNNNPHSIMYPQTSEAVALSPDDISGLEKACERESVFKTGIENFALLVNQIRLRLISNN